MPELIYSAGTWLVPSLYNGCGGKGFGSGTHGLQRRTFMPPFRSAKSDGTTAAELFKFAPDCEMDAADGAATAGGG